MGEVLSFFARGDVPSATFQAKGISRRRNRRGGLSPFVTDTPVAREMKATLEEMLRPFAPVEPIEGPIRLSLEIDFAFPASAAKRVQSLGRVVKTTKPDCSNLAKGIEDRLAHLGFFTGDELVVDLHTRKFWSHHPGIYVRIEQVDNPQAPERGGDAI